MPEKQKPQNAKTIFDDPESRRNIVGLFNLLLKIDRRINPQFYALKNEVEDMKPDKKT